MALVIRRTPAPPVVGDIVPSATAFDFLEGGFARAERARAVGLAGAGVALVALASVGLFGMTQGLEASNLEGEIVAAQTELSEVAGELAVLDSAGGFSSAQITAHISAQEAALAAAVGSEWDTVRLTGDILASAPAGVRVTKVRFDDDTAPVTVTIAAKATSFTVLPSWSGLLAGIDGLVDVDVTWSGGGSNLSVEATATLSPDAVSARARAVGGAGPAPQAPAQDGTATDQDPGDGTEDLLDELEGGQL